MTDLLPEGIDGKIPEVMRDSICVLHTDQLLSHQLFFPQQEMLDKMEIIEDLQEDIRLYYRAWERVKGG